MPTFGQIIAEARKKKRLSQKELASMVEREDGKTISPQYLNDIERSRRSPGDYVLQQFARVLELNEDYLYYLVGEYPADLRELAANVDTFQVAMRAFRRSLEKKDDMGS